MSSTRDRLVTGIPAAIAVILLLAYGGVAGFAGLLLLVVLLATREAAKMIEGDARAWPLLFILAAAYFPGIINREVEWLIVAVMASTLGSGVWAIVRAGSSEDTVNDVARRWGLLCVASIWLGALPAMGVALRAFEFGASWILITLVAAFLGDTGAYFAGRAFGKHKLGPLSPKKTWEGVVGGFPVGILGVLIVHFLYFDTMAWWHALVIAPLINCAGIFGDLAASALKRAAGVKDSGVFLPGHGGALDRIDSAVFALPVGYLIVRFLFNPEILWMLPL